MQDTPKDNPILQSLMSELIELSPARDGVSVVSYCEGCRLALGVTDIVGGIMLNAPCSCKVEVYEKFWNAYEKYRRVEEQAQHFDRFVTDNKIGPRLGAATFKNFETYGTPTEIGRQERALSACKAYAHFFDNKTVQWMVLAGGCGTGKGHLAMSIMRSIIERGEGPCRFISMDRMMLEIGDTYRKDSPVSTKKYLDALCEVRLLTIDDLGRNININEHVRGRLFTIINTRNLNMLPTIFTTNMLPKDDDNPERSTLKKVLGQANYERIFDKTTDNLYVPFEWRSYREKK